MQLGMALSCTKPEHRRLRRLPKLTEVFGKGLRSICQCQRDGPRLTGLHKKINRFRRVPTGLKYIVIRNLVAQPVLFNGPSNTGFDLRHHGGHRLIRCGAQGHPKFSHPRRDSKCALP